MHSFSKRINRLDVLLACLAFLVFPAGISSAQQEASNVIKVEQLIRHHVGGRIPIRTYATIVVPATAFPDDVTMVAELDLDNSMLTVSTRNGVRLTGRISVEVNFDRFPSGLSVQFVTGKAEPRPGPGAARKFTGTISKIDVRHRRLSVDGPDSSREFVIPNNLAVTRQENTQQPQTVSLEDLGIGDDVTISLRDDAKTPQTVEARYRMVSGVVRSATARRIVLNPNTAYSVNANVYVFAAHGDELEMGDLRPGQRVSMRLNPTSNEVWEITSGSLKGAAVIQSVSHDAQGDLQAGDVLTATLVAQPGGTATFDLEGVQTGIIMRESATRGTYTGRYTVLNRAMPARARVIATFESADGRKEARAADETLRFVGNDRFEAPSLTSPKDGETAGSSIIVKGQTAANGRVTIKIAYLRRGLLGDTRGAMPDVSLNADAKGNFESQPIALKGPRLILEESVDYTITCFATRADGKQSEEAVVNVIRK